MNISDETLMAYVDNELDADARTAIEAALANDPDLARRLAAQRALLGALSATYDPVLDEPIPDRLMQAALGKPVVVDLAKVRASRKDGLRAPQPRWQNWAALAATLILGIIVGRFGAGVSSPPEVAINDNRIIVGEGLARALSEQLASTQPASAPVKIGLSFVAQSGQYCRTFTADQMAGVACKNEQTWRVQVLADAAASHGDYRQAASEMPPVVLQSVTAAIAGEALDADAEKAARDSGWRR